MNGDTRVVFKSYLFFLFLFGKFDILIQFTHSVFVKMYIISLVFFGFFLMIIRGKVIILNHFDL